MSHNRAGRGSKTGRIGSLKPLTKAKTFEDLCDLADHMVNEKKLTASLFKSLESCVKQAEVLRNDGDEETEFIVLRRFTILFRKAYKDLYRLSGEEQAKIKSTALLVESRFKEVQGNLKKRYEELNRSILNMNKVDSNGNVPGLTPMETEDIVEPPKKKAEAPKPSLYVTSTELHQLFKSNSARGSLFIVDCRAKEDFEKCKLNKPDDGVTIINLPKNVISPGLSAAKIKSLLSNALVSSWERRNFYDAIILIDEDSTRLNPGTPLEYVYNALTKWDPNVTYRSPPKILTGGIEELVATYPSLLTNPARFITSTPKQSLQLNSLGSFSYPEELISEDLPLSKKTTTEPPSTLEPPVALEDVNLSIEPRLSLQLFEDDPAPILDSLANDPVVINGANLTAHLDKLRRLKPGDITVPSQGNLASSSSSSSSSVNENSVAPRPDITLELNELRKNKPEFKPSSKAPSRREDDGDSNDSTYQMPLKRDSSVTSGSRLRRTSSSPNISRAAEEEVSRHPVINRANKPSTPSHIPYRPQNYTFGEGLDVIYGDTSPGLTGLKNFANNCYMNSIVQCLSNTQPLVKELVNLEKPRLNSTSRSRGKIAQELMEVFRCMWSGSIKICSIKELKSLMGSIKDIFKGSAHQDSNEFLVILLDHLHDDLNMPAEPGTLLGAEESTGERAWGEFMRKNCSVIQRLFYGQHRSSVKCRACNHVSYTFEQFFNLYVPIPSGDSLATLEDCLQLYMTGEKITGWTCPKCKIEREAVKKLDISRLPPILVIALKRFTQEDGSWLRKKEKLVHYRLDGLDMSQFVVPGSEQRHSRYNLYAASIHSGTLQSGHYRAICKNSLNQRWYMFDDQTVESLPLPAVQSNPEVYILFYCAVKQ